MESERFALNRALKGSDALTGGDLTPWFDSVLRRGPNQETVIHS